MQSEPKEVGRDYNYLLSRLLSCYDEGEEELRFLVKGFKFFMAFLAIGLGLAFIRYFGHNVYFPFFPNILDSALMIGIGGYFLMDSLRKREQ